MNNRIRNIGNVEKPKKGRLGAESSSTVQCYCRSHHALMTMRLQPFFFLFFSLPSPYGCAV
jgi:hypothetical protein